MTIWLTSDTHFGCEGIIRMAGRPFADVARMDDGLVQVWNSLVRPRDVVWHLGDFAHGSRGPAARIFARLHGEKHLMVGNHDGHETTALPWASVQDAADLHVDGVRLTLCHYPMLVWRGSDRNGDGHVDAVMCHGHVHGTPRYARVPNLDPCRLDVGIDMRSMAPVQAETVVEEARVASALAAEDDARKAN